MPSLGIDKAQLSQYFDRLKMISFTNISGAEEIGSNSYLLEMDGTRIVLDAGMHPKKEGLAAVPQYDLIGEAGSLDAIFVTHSHLDHLGTLPVLQDKQPGAEVFMTPATAALSSVMLHNSVNVMTSKRMELGIVEYPFFTHSELDRLSESWITHSCGEAFRIGSKKNVLATLYDAGHILGSAGVMLESESGGTVFYTGDVQFEDQSMIPGADFPDGGVDTLITECTRGNYDRPEDYARQAELKRFADAITATIERGGAVLVPVFALGKSQEMLYNLDHFKAKGWIPASTPVYFGGLSAKVTHFYDKFDNKTRRMDPGYLLKQEVDVVPLPRNGRGALRCEPGAIYLVSSGMMSEKTISNMLAEQVLPNEKNSILFVGYCDPDSPAGMLKEMNVGDTVRLRRSGHPVPIHCDIKWFDFSGHSARNLLVDYAKRIAPKRVILVHGDPEAVEWMRASLRQELPNTEILIPISGQTYNLD